MTDDLEDRFLPLFGRCLRHQEPADPQMVRGTRFLRDQRIGRFPYPVMNEHVRIVPPFEQLLVDGLPQRRLKPLCRALKND